MIFKDFNLTEDNHFVAMEYYMLILNRTYLVLITDDLLIGILANGIVAVEGGRRATKQVTRTLAIQGNLTNPHSYIKDIYIEMVENDNLLDGSILKRSKSNFIIKRKDITSAIYDPKKKWGMGYYPHDGKVYVVINSNKKREFIILGDQSGQKIANLVSPK